jgi:4-hydroxy-2-oxoglutarate aldolase
VDYYSEAADRVPMPVLIYNAPGFAGGVSLSAGAVSRLADHGNIVGMKDSAPTGPGGFLAALGRRREFSVLAGSTNFFYPSMVLGAVGGVLSSANYLPEACCRLYTLIVEGDHAEALALHNRLVRINRAVSSRFGVAGVKVAMECRGYRGGEPRSPLKALDAGQREAICRVLEDADL